MNNQEQQQLSEFFLGGMESAFITSIIGMGMSLYFKNFQFNAQKNSKTIINSDANISDLIQYLQKSDAEKNNFLKALNDSLVGDGEYTVVGQIKMIRFDINEKFKSVEKILQDNNQQMLNAFENFAETLAENNSKLFIEALNETMKDFNQKLSEQFGENFKQLNIAVGRLLEWQENYKQTVEIVTKDLQLTFEGIESVKNSIAEIEKSANSMTESSKQIQNLIVTANFYENKLQQVLQEIQTLGANANTSVDNLNEKIIGTTENVTELTKQIIFAGNKTLAEISEVANENSVFFKKVLNQFGTEIQNYTEQAAQDVNSHINSTTDNLNEKLQATLIKTNNMTASINSFGNTTLNKISNATEETITSMQKMAVEFHNESFKITSETAEKMNEMMLANDKNFQESLETLGKAMLQISKKFAQDYEPLANELKKIVEISKQVKQLSKGGLF